MRPLLTLFMASLLFLGGCDKSANANSDRYNPSKLKELTNLQTLAKQSREQNLPIMLTVGAEWCEFCHQLREEVLDPMALGGDYEGRYMFMRYLSIDDHAPIPGLDGSPIIKNKLAYRLNADLTPTVVFIDGHGNEVADKIIGIANIELYTTLIHKRLNQAYQKMNNPLRIDAFPTPANQL